MQVLWMSNWYSFITWKQTGPEARPELGPKQLADSNKELWQEILTLFKKKDKHISLFKYLKTSRLGPGFYWMIIDRLMNEYRGFFLYRS